MIISVFMKILHLIDSGGLYGAEKMLISLAVQQIKLGDEPTIGSLRKPDSSEKAIEYEASRNGLNLQLFNMRSGFNIFGALEIIQFAKQNGFDVIHTHGYKPNILLGFVPRFLRVIPVIRTLHGWTSTSALSKMHINQIVDALSLKFVDQVVLVSKAMADNLAIKKIPTDKISIIENGIDIDTTNSDIFDKHHFLNDHINDEVFQEKILNFCNESFVLISIGRLSKEKGYDNLIEAMRILIHDFNHDVKLLLVGEGQERDSLSALAAKYEISDNLLITGYIDNAKYLLPLANCYVISSLTEGLPITLLEAMSFSIPVVATKVGGIPYVLNDGEEGILVRPGDPSDISRAIEKVFLNVDLSRNLARNARSKLINSYTSEVMARSYMHIYRETLDSK